MAASWGLDHRCSSDLVLLWLWCRPAATVLIRPLSITPQVLALKRKKEKKKKKRLNKIGWVCLFSLFLEGLSKTQPISLSLSSPFLLYLLSIPSAHPGIISLIPPQPYEIRLLTCFMAKESETQRGTVTSKQ